MIRHQKEESPIDPRNEEELVSEVQSIVHLFMKTLAQVKLFSFLHANTKKFVDELCGRFSAFFEKNSRLDLDIGEFTFFYKKKIVYEDTQISKSLPFLFHKDGLKTLSFLRGLDREEIEGFLEIIKEVSQFPPEEGDIVVLLWERDFANIHYYAPDEFLETKIGIGKETPLEYQLDPSSLQTGRFELLPEDREALAVSKATLFSSKEMKLDSEESIDQRTESGFFLRLPSLVPEELETLEEMIQKDRSMASQEEFLNLAIEMSYLEERGEEFNSIMEVLVQNHREVVQRGEFLKGASLLSHMIDLKEKLASHAKERAERIEIFLKEIRSGSTLSLIENTFDEGHVDDLDEFFKYVYLFGPYSLKLVGDLYEKKENPAFRQKTLSNMRYFIGEDLPSVVEVLGDSRPEFTKGSLSVMSEIDDEKIAESLAICVDFKNPDLKKRAIRTISRFKGQAAVQILKRFMEDPDSSVRTEAALGFQSSPDDALLNFLLPQMISRNFHRRGKEEKAAFVGLLTKSSSEKVLDVLRTYLRKSHFYTSPKRIGTALSVVSVLEANPVPQAFEILKIGQRSTHPKLRKAARRALAVIKQKQISEERPLK
jgi:hypothetical protein